MYSFYRFIHFLCISVCFLYAYIFFYDHITMSYNIVKVLRCLFEYTFFPIGTFSMLQFKAKIIFYYSCGNKTRYIISEMQCCIPVMFRNITKNKEKIWENTLYTKFTVNKKPTLTDLIISRGCHLLIEGSKPR